MLTAHAPPSLVSRFAFRDPSLWWARARLEAEHLVLTGWTWRGRYRRYIALSRILYVDVRDTDELVLWLFEGEVLRLRIPRAQRWKAEIEAYAEDRSAGRAARLSSDRREGYTGST